MAYRIFKTEDISRTLVIDVEASSADEAEEIFKQMCYTGEFYDEAHVDHEEVLESWDEMVYVEPTTGEHRRVRL